MAVWNSAFYGGAIPNATDYVDLMTRLADALTGATAPSSGTLPVAQRWTLLLDDTTSVPGERRMYLQGPGLAGTDQIHVNIRSYVGALNIRNWDIRGATAFNAGLDFYNQPGTSDEGSIYTLRDLELPFRIIADGRRFILLTKVVLSNMACYAGFGLPFATPTEYPYPLFIGANSAYRDAFSGDNDYRIGNFYDGPGQTTSTSSSLDAFRGACFHVRDRNGEWLRGGRYTTPSSGVTTRPTERTFANAVVVWPWDYGPATNTGVTTSGRVFDWAMYATPEGTQPILPAIVYTGTPLSQIQMELPGVYYTPSGNLSTEDTITDGSDVYFVINNTYRDNEVNGIFKLE